MEGRALRGDSAGDLRADQIVHPELARDRFRFIHHTTHTEAIIGAFAGGVGALLTNPFDILTTRIVRQTPNEDDKPLGIIGMGRRVYEESGVQAFAVGWEARGERIFANLFFLDIGRNLIASVSGLLGTCHLYLSISLLLSEAGGSGEQLVSHGLVKKRLARVSNYA